MKGLVAIYPALAVLWPPRACPRLLAIGVMPGILARSPVSLVWHGMYACGVRARCALYHTSFWSCGCPPPPVSHPSVVPVRVGRLRKRRTRRAWCSTSPIVAYSWLDSWGRLFVRHWAPEWGSPYSPPLPVHPPPFLRRALSRVSSGIGSCTI